MSKTIQEVLAERDEKMAEYYQSVYKHGFDGGYPIAWDTEALSDIRKLLEGVLPVPFPDTTAKDLRSGIYRRGDDEYRKGHNQALNDTKEAINKIIGEQE